MTDLRTAPNAGRFEVKVTADTHFGWIRTRLSVERTMMSWQRTATALIGFGFAIVQYLNHLQQTPETRDFSRFYGGFLQWARQNSNLRPRPYQGRALTN